MEVTEHRTRGHILNSCPLERGQAAEPGRVGTGIEFQGNRSLRSLLESKCKRLDLGCHPQSCLESPGPMLSTEV